MRTIIIETFFISCFLIGIVTAQTPTLYSPSIPTPGMPQEVDALEQRILVLEAAVIALIDDRQAGIRLDVEYMPTTGRTAQFTKQAWLDMPPGTNRGFALITDLLASGQISIDQWETIKVSLMP